jgi:AraC family transcriptional regulator of adaptative response/methylated-DNA-[protein]-cysteine methyltransferase
VAAKGICALKFIDEEKSRNEFRLFSEQWRFARLVHSPEFTQQYIRRIFYQRLAGGGQPSDSEDQLSAGQGRPMAGRGQRHEQSSAAGDLQLLVKGTDFQIKVWEALLHIPFGSVSSFQQVASLIGRPDAARAVGSAVGANHILYLIPCHRIISADGSLGNYHYGKARKLAMIGWEISQT